MAERTHVDITRDGFTWFIGFELPVVDPPNRFIERFAGTFSQRLAKLGFGLLGEFSELGSAEPFLGFLPRRVTEAMKVVDIEGLEHLGDVFGFEVEESDRLGLTRGKTGELDVGRDADAHWTYVMRGETEDRVVSDLPSQPVAAFTSALMCSANVMA